MRQRGRTVVTVGPNAISLRSGHSRFGIARRPATHAAACVFTQFRASRPALNFNTCSNRAIGPFGLYFPVLAIFEHHTKYGSSRRHFSPTHT